MKNLYEDLLMFVLSVLVVFIVGGCVTGWAMNLGKLFLVINDPFTAKTVLRLIGIPMWPIGIVLGFVS